MNYHTQITAIKETDEGTDLIVHIPGEKVRDKILKIRNGKIINSEIRIDDNRHITSEQRRKIYATIKDISDFTGNVPEYLKEFLKFTYCSESGEDYFSLSNCSITTARLFINHIMDFILEHNIPLSEEGLKRTDDIDHYLWSCIKFKKCCICGQKSDVHHVNAIGRGINRNTYDDSKHLKMALCRTHHTEAHKIGREPFAKKYHVYGIIYNED